MTKNNIWKLRDTILENIDYLSTEYKITNDILCDLNRMISLDMSNNLIFHWWVENETSIDTINKLLQKLKD